MTGDPPLGTASVLAATAAELGDDASVMCIDWHGSNSPDKGRRPIGRRLAAGGATGS